MGKFLDIFKERFGSYAMSQGSGGCATCGYGASDVISEYDYSSMLKEMDEWIEAQFSSPNQSSIHDQ